jgi:hypothetical protein
MTSEWIDRIPIHLYPEYDLVREGRIDLSADSTNNSSNKIRIIKPLLLLLPFRDVTKHHPRIEIPSASCQTLIIN